MSVDYYIYSIHYKNNDKSESIDEVRTSSESAGPKSRETVVVDIENNKSIKTAIKDKNDGKYYEGKDVHVIKIDGKKYLRTDKNATKKDNLENLPTYNK